MGKQTDRVKRLQEKVQRVFDLFPEIPMVFIEELLDIPGGHVPVWISRGKVTKPDNLATAYGWRYDGVIKREQPGKPPKGQKPHPRWMGVVAPAEPSPPPPQAKSKPAPPVDDDEPDCSVEGLRAMTKRQLAHSISDAKATAAYAQALNHLMNIQVREQETNVDEETIMHSYVPAEDIGPDDE